MAASNGDLLEKSLASAIGDRTAKVFEKAFGYTSVGDLLRHYPRRYVMRGERTNIDELRDGDEVTVIAVVKKVNLRRNGKRSIFEVIITDGTSEMSLTFFNQPWREKQLQPGVLGMFAGKVGQFNKKKQLAHPDFEVVPEDANPESAVDEFAGKAIPVYPATSKMPSWKIAQAIEIALDSITGIAEPLPELIRKRLKYPTLEEAFRAIHMPRNREEAELARARLTFDEALILQLFLAQRREEMRSQGAVPRKIKTGGIVSEFENLLPFTLTEGQREVSLEIENDMASDHPMYRLLQGEVGSGKTVVALRAMLIAIDAGGQAALLAPTEVLAAQHYATIRKILGPLAEAGTLGGSEHGTRVSLLTGSMSTASKKAVYADIASGEAGIVIGTHALLNQTLNFKDLALIVVDEQHRFGVEQRDALRAKAKLPPHVLVMTATPIPRTVAMTVFGDLDVSTLRQLPSGRPAITTHVVPALDKPHYLQRAWERIREEVGKGHQAYVVAPRISANVEEDLTPEELALAKTLGLVDEEDEKSRDMYSVEALAPELATGPLKGLKVALLHGRMPAEEKEETMLAFSAGEIDVLVSTTVIEVGVDVPNASVMVIMDADRFGVSQLHQLRGRVGRGKVAGLCLLVSHAADDSLALERLNAVASTLDGFELSRIDLEQRSEGDVLGRAQSGTKSHLRLLRVLRDEAVIDEARNIASEIVSHDPDLSSMPELAREVASLRAEESASFAEKG